MATQAYARAGSGGSEFANGGSRGARGRSSGNVAAGAGKTAKETRRVTLGELARYVLLPDELGRTQPPRAWAGPLKAAFWAAVAIATGIVLGRAL